MMSDYLNEEKKLNSAIEDYLAKNLEVSLSLSYGTLTIKLSLLGRKIAEDYVDLPPCAARAGS
jgi:hypothetical protein